MTTYSEPNDLLKEIEDNFIEENLALFSPYFQENYETDQLAGMFTYILNNQRICRALMGSNGNPLFLERIQNMFRDNVIDRWCQEFPRYNRADLDYVFDFIFAGAMRLILNWIDNGHGLPTQELARRLDRLGHYCHLAIREFR